MGSIELEVESLDSHADVSTAPRGADPARRCAFTLRSVIARISPQQRWYSKDMTVAAPPSAPARAPISRALIRPFQRLSAAVAAHGAADIMVAVALANTLFFAAPADAARHQVVLYLALAMLPVALLTPVVDTVLAKHARQLRHTLIVASAARAGIAAGLVLWADTVALYPLALLLLVASRAHGIARISLVPDVLPEDKPLIWANTWLSVAMTGGAALGAGIATIVVALTGTPGALVAAACFYAFSAVAAVGRSVHAAPVLVREIDLVGGERLPARTVAAGTALAVIRFATGFLTFLLAFAAKDDPAFFSAIVAAAVIGGALGTFAAGASRSLMPAWLLPPVLLAVLAAMAASAAVDVHSVWGFAVAATAAFSWSAGKVAFDGSTQALTCPRGRRKAVARYAVGFQLCWVIGGAAAIPPIDSSYAMGALAVGCALGLVGALRQANLRAPSLATTLAALSER